MQAPAVSVPTEIAPSLFSRPSSVALGEQFPAPVENSGTMCARGYAWLILCSVLLSLAVSSPAHAQSWLSDRKRAEGRGLRVGDFELHPGIGAEIGYYTNPFNSDRPNGSASLRVAPHLYLSTLKEDRREREGRVTQPGWLSFTGGVSATFQHFFERAVRDAINLDLNGDATLAPERPVSFRVTQLFRRSAVPFGDTTVLPVGNVNVNTAPDRPGRGPDFTNYYENAGAYLQFQSPGGLLKGGLGYRFGYAWFDAIGFEFNNNMTHSALLNLGWEFLPKTALFYDASYVRQLYPKLDNVDLAQSRQTSLSNSDQVLTRIGLNGAITTHIGATAAIGYAAGFYETGDDASLLIANADIRYTPSAMSELGLTYDKTFVPSYQGNFQDRHRVFARARWLFFGTTLLTVRGGIEFLKFGFDLVQQSGRNDRRYFADVGGEYRFIDWLAATVQFHVLADDTDFVFRSTPQTAANPARFTSMEVWFGVRAFL